MKNCLKKIIIFLLQKEAHAMLRRHEPSIVAVTGSVGKTTTKDAIFTALAAVTTVRKSEKSFNSEIGVPLTVLGLANGWNNPFVWIKNLLFGAWQLIKRDSYPSWLVLEVGADRPGDIKSTASWVRPHIAVLTRLPDVPVHVEHFSSPQEVIAEKMTLAEALRISGSVVANGDDPIILDQVKRRALTAITYGFSEGVYVRASEYEITYQKDDQRKVPSGISFSVSIVGNQTPFRFELSGCLGVQHVYPVLAALCVVKAAGFDPAKAVPVLATHQSPPGRMRLLKGIHESVIIDDTYNSSPIATLEAVRTLLSLQCAGRKIAVLGDMLELGKYSVTEHEAIGKEVAFVDVLVTVGPRSRDVAQAAVRAGKDARTIFSFAESKKAALYLSHILEARDIVLVKGSQGMRMERVSAALLDQTAHSIDVLVRQDEEWQKR